MTNGDGEEGGQGGQSANTVLKPPSLAETQEAVEKDNQALKQPLDVTDINGIISKSHHEGHDRLSVREQSQLNSHESAKKNALSTKSRIDVDVTEPARKAREASAARARANPTVAPTPPAHGATPMALGNIKERLDKLREKDQTDDEDNNGGGNNTPPHP